VSPSAENQAYEENGSEAASDRPSGREDRGCPVVRDRPLSERELEDGLHPFARDLPVVPASPIPAMGGGC
jgi:hypothetical protein